jgi:DNA-binding beta-propeller fold protein YncE
MSFDGLGNLYIALNISGVSSRIGKYTTSGNAVNASLITGLYDPAGLAVDNQGHLFVSQEEIGVVSEYTTSGSTLNASLVQGLNLPSGLALDGQGNLFVVNQGEGSVCEYTTSGDVVNASLITGLHGLYSIAVVVPEPSATILVLAGAAVLIARRRGMRVSLRAIG